MCSLQHPLLEMQILRVTPGLVDQKLWRVGQVISVYSAVQVILLDHLGTPALLLSREGKR